MASDWPDSAKPSYGIIWSEPCTLSKLKAEIHIIGDVKGRLRSGRPKKTTPQEDHFITLSALRCRRLSSTDLQSRFAGRYGRRLSAQTIRNRLHAANLRSHRADRSPAMTALPHQARMHWCRQHVHWNLNIGGTLCSVMSPVRHEEEVPGCCGCVWFFYTLLRLLFVK